MKRSLNLWLLLLAFIVPVILAWVMLSNQWYQGGVTNRGKLLDEPVQLAWLSPEQPQWQLWYFPPTPCDQSCAGALFNLRQVPQVIGEPSQRLASKLLVQPAVQRAEAENALLSGMETKPITVAEQQAWQHLPYGGAAIYVMDPHGTIMLAYPIEQEKPAIMAQGKAMVRDIKRLLKLSRIG
ncbi:cytochrome oxidase [Thaumasiovibrio sp. DFM-14]|uniref:cytochrome oxidase n=1 Tax=Thaumasiovibrio sp. DFM-14 TaxID=3384792 RepID=UPI0039A3EE8F